MVARSAVADVTTASELRAHRVRLSCDKIIRDNLHIGVWLEIRPDGGGRPYRRMVVGVDTHLGEITIARPGRSRLDREPRNAQLITSLTHVSDEFVGDLSYSVVDGR